MTKLPLIAFAAIVAAGGLAMPALAAMTVPAGNVPLCSSASGSERIQGFVRFALAFGRGFLRS